MNKLLEFCRKIRQSKCDIALNEPLSKHTTFKVGGPAACFVQPQDESSLIQAVALCKSLDLPYYILGNGSNVLFEDSGYIGVVISTSKMNNKIELLDEITIRCESGVKTSQLCKFALENNITGFEFLWGIPGTVGGAVYMNAGAYDGEMKQIVREVRYFNNSGSFCTMEYAQLEMSYRNSAFQHNNGIITFITMSGEKGEKNDISSKMNDLLSRRKDKQPLDYPSAGSTFKRPAGYYAAALIEECDLKGCSVGGATVSNKHAGFIINKGGASCADILGLVKIVQDTVFAKTGITLECEIRVVRNI